MHQGKKTTLLYAHAHRTLNKTKRTKSASDTFTFFKSVFFKLKLCASTTATVCYIF